MLKKNTIKTIVLLCCLMMIFTGCKQNNAIIRYDVNRGTKNLDPQFATDETAQLIIYNTFEGLLRSLPSGEIVPAAAESYNISTDETVYTFTLRSGMRWKNGDPVTAADFEFAFKRMFNPITKSPFVQQYSVIKNADKVIAGELTADSLAVKAEDERTLTIELEKPNAFFTQILTHSSAMPCNKKSFDKSGGRYGLRLDTIDCNGPFYVKYWDNQSYIGLRKNSKYFDEHSVTTNGVNIYINRKNSANPKGTVFDMLMQDDADSARATYEQMKIAVEKGYTADKSVDTVWCLIFNQAESSEFKVLELRQAFSQAIDRVELEKQLKNGLSTATRIMPPAVTLLGTGYNETVKVPLYYDYSPQLAQTAYKQGLAILDVPRINNIRFLVSDVGSTPEIAVYLQQMWQKDLGAYVNMSVLPQEEIDSKTKEGAYDIALVAFRPDMSRSGDRDILDRFVSTSSSNITGYNNTDYDIYVKAAQFSVQNDEIINNYRKAEMLLSRDVPVFPLWYQTGYYINGKDVSGIVHYPEPQRTYFKYAIREK
ncbi:MAG: peptide ABC transporter substrate-binding protein [Oscillospiraceae bacterium]